MMGFAVDFPKSTKGNKAILVIMNRLTNSAHFLPIRITFPKDQLVRLYMNETVRCMVCPFQLYQVEIQGSY